MNEGLRSLAKDDLKLLKESWSIISKDIQKTGVNIFLMIFKQCPEAKFLFPLTYNEHKDSDFIKFHSLRFMQAIKSTINSIENLDELDPLLKNLGRVHGKLKERVDFKPEYWGVFRECTLYHFRKALESISFIDKIRRLFGLLNSRTAHVDYLIILWGILLDYIINGMTLSFRADVRARELNKNNWIQNDEEHNYLKGKRETMKTQRTKQMKTVNEQNKRNDFCCGLR